MLSPSQFLPEQSDLSAALTRPSADYQLGDVSADTTVGQLMDDVTA